MHGCGRKVRPVTTRVEVERLMVERFELLARPLDLASERVVVPLEPGVHVLRRLVGSEVERPVEVEGGALEPVALPEGVGEALTDAAGRVDPDHVPPGGRLSYLADGGVAVGYVVTAGQLGRLRLGVEQQEGIVVHHGDTTT